MIDRARLTELYAREWQDFVARHPMSATAYDRSDHLRPGADDVDEQERPGASPSIWIGHGATALGISTASSTSISRWAILVRCQGTRPRRP